MKKILLEMLRTADAGAICEAFECKPFCMTLDCVDCPFFDEENKARLIEELK